MFSTYIFFSVLEFTSVTHSMIASAVEMLMDETPGGEVIQFLKKKSKKLSSLNAAMSLVRVALMKEENRSPECDFRELASCDFQREGDTGIH